MLARTYVRALLVEQLQLYFQGVADIHDSRTLPLTPDRLPAMVVTTPYEKKNSLGRDAPVDFYTTVAVDLKIRTTGPDDAGAQIALEALVEGVENATLANQVVFDAVNYFPSVESTVSVSTEGKFPLAEASMRFLCEVPETFDPSRPVPLKRIEAAVPVGTETISAAIDLPQP